MTEYEAYDGRAIRPLLMKIAKEKKKSYLKVKEVFLKEFAKGSEKRLKYIIENNIEKSLEGKE